MGNRAMDVLRHHVSGAVERGDAEPIVAMDASAADTHVPPGQREEFHRCREAIRYIRRNDCDFLTVENVLTYAQLGLRYEQVARLALIAEMGLEWYREGVAYVVEHDDSWDQIPGQVLVVTPEARHFAVVQGRRWTRVHEYLSNGQLTARFFVDESTGEAREAEGWRKPKRWPMGMPASAYARSIVMAAAARR